MNVLALSRMLGHKSAKVTLVTYADLFDTDLDAVAEALEAKCAHWSRLRLKISPLPARTGGGFWRWRRDLNPIQLPGRSADMASTS